MKRCNGAGIDKKTTRAQAKQPEPLLSVTKTDDRSKARRFFDYWQPATASSHGGAAYAFIPQDGGHYSVLRPEYCAHKRRFLPAYQKRLKLVRDAWLYLFSGVLIFQVAAPFAISLCLFSTFLSFAFLDETPISVTGMP